MAKNRVDFFAMPDEQRDWLQQLFKSDALWCVLRQSPPNTRVEEITEAALFANPSLDWSSGVGETQLHVGCREIVAEPVWSAIRTGLKDIDFIQSQAIQVVLSRQVDDRILLEGQIGIMHEASYRDAGIDPAPLQKWFRSVANSLKRLRANVAVVLRDPASKQERRYPGIVATAGAVQWRRSGRVLKQFVDGAYEFDIQASDNQE